MRVRGVFAKITWAEFGMWHNYVFLNDDYSTDTGTGFEVHGLWSYWLEWRWKWFLNFHCLPCLYGPDYYLLSFACLPVIALWLVNWYFKLAPNLKRIVSFSFIFNIYEFMQNFSAACIIFPVFSGYLLLCVATSLFSLFTNIL